MIPSAEILTQEMIEEETPSRTYAIRFAQIDIEDSVVDKISGFIEDLESLKQAIYLILSTERYEFLIYSWDYGIETVDLYGQPMPYVMAELERRITEALMIDDRITNVTDFEMTPEDNKLLCTFTVESIYGSLQVEKEVEI